MKFTPSKKATESQQALALGAWAGIDQRLTKREEWVFGHFLLQLRV